MTAWNDHHYARAQEFTRLLADALLAAKSSEPTPALELTAAPFLRSSVAAATPIPAAPAAPLPLPEAAPAPAAPAPGPTASSVFKKIPWKK